MFHQIINIQIDLQVKSTGIADVFFQSKVKS